MRHLVTHLGRATAVLSLGIASLVAAAPAVHAVVATPASYPGVPYADVPVSSITSTGWSLCWSGGYNDNALVDDVLAACTGDYLLLAGGFTDADSFTVAAAGPRSAVTTVTSANGTTYADGTYWYYNDRSMGFSPTSTIFQDSADGYDTGYEWGGFDTGLPTNAWRLSWHTGGTGSGPTEIHGGWRAGTYNGNSFDMGSMTRYIYQADLVAPGAWSGGHPYEAPAPGQPQLVVDALNVRTTMGQAVAQDYRVLGLVGSDTVTNVVLEYEGTNIRGEHFGPSTTAPTFAGDYTVSVKSYTLTAADASVYWQTKHAATLTVLWAPLPIADVALAAAPNAGGAAAASYAKTGATASGTGWSVSVNGAPASAAGGMLLTDAGAVLAVTGKGFKPYTAVRMWFMSDPTELGSVWTDANGSFSKSVTLPGTASGSHTLQVNGYGVDGKVRTVNVALAVGSAHLLSTTALFDPRSAEIKASIAARLQQLLMSVPSAPWTVHVTVATSSAGAGAAAMKLAEDRVNAVADRLRSSMEAAGVTVVVETTIWNQPGLKTSNARQLRLVYIDLNW